MIEKTFAICGKESNMEKNWYGFACEEMEFEGQAAMIVFPKENPVGKLVLKVEYWGAFPDIEIKLLERGYHLAYVKNKSRLAPKEDCDIKARFVKFLAEKYGLSEKCIPVGMSCGGAHAVRFAGFYPELIACLYIDAPVLNFACFPGKFGDEYQERVWETEFIIAYPGVKRYQMVNFSEHPLNMAPTLLAHKIPIIMVCGKQDDRIIYEEHGKLLEDAYAGTDLMKVIHVPNRGHHPHGMIHDNKPIVDFIVENS